MFTISPEDQSHRHANDPASGLTYPLPQGWHRYTEDLVEPFTSAIANTTGALVGSGRWDHLLAAKPSSDELIAGAAWLASEYGEFFLPYEGDRVDVVMEKATLAGLPAARAGYRLLFQPGKGSPAYVRVLVVALRTDQISFMMAVAPDSEARMVESIMARAYPADPDD